MKSLLKLKKYFIRYKKKLLLGVLFILISAISEVTIPWFLKEAIDAFQNNITFGELLKWALLIVAASAIGGIFRYLIRQTVIVVSREVEYDMRQDLWTYLLKLPAKYFHNTSTGDIMAHATNDIGAVRMFVGPAVMYSIDTITQFILIISLMIFFLNPELTLYTLLPFPFLSYFVYLLSKKIHQKFTKIQEKFSELTTKAQESFSGIRVVKSYVREESEFKHFAKLSGDYLKRNMEKVKIQAFFMPLLFIVSGLSIIIAIWLGGNMIMNGKLTLGELAAFIGYLSMLIWPMIAFGWIVSIVQQAAASMERLLKIMSEEIENYKSESSDTQDFELNGKIKFDKVSFKYNSDKDFVLKNISLTIPAGATVAFVGKTGEGKSTIINLISKLYETTSGKILIDDIEIENIPLSILRRDIAIVPQESFLFSETLRENILYGVRKNYPPLDELARVSSLTQDLLDFPNGFETIIGERGITLSGGQKQRVCLARALAVEPKILILDDSFSAVDTHTEEEILNNLKGYIKKRTTIIISHRISTVKNADKIYVLEKEKIIEEGTHKELLRQKGLYAQLHKKQLLEEEIKEIV